MVYTGDVDATPEEILARARQRFNIVLPSTVEFVFLHGRGWVEASRYPFLTLLGQSFGSVVLGFEALYRFVPDTYVDTMGYAFTLPLFRYLANCPVASYVHYPTISTDMLEKVGQRQAAHNNASFISSSPTLSSLKLVYYKLFAWLYGVAGACNDVIMVNSTWTYNHIRELWATPTHTHVLYPPCDIAELVKIPLESDETKPRQILSLGQFRPEKDHPLQIRAFKQFVSSLGASERDKYKLVLAGGCRDDRDEARVSGLRHLASELGVSDLVDFRLNIPFTELKQLLTESLISLHTMWNEHFGICE